MANKKEWNVLVGKIYPLPNKDLVPKPTINDFDLFESQFLVRAPASYRSFLRRFGPGRLVDKYLIFAPNCIGNRILDLTDFNKTFRKSFDNNLDVRSYYKDPHLVRRLVYFCRTLDNDYFGWDPKDVSDPKNSEMPVHFMKRLDKESKIVASTFREFIEQFCLKPLNITSSRDAIGDEKSYLFHPAQLTPQGRKKLSKNQNSNPDASAFDSTSRSRKHHKRVEEDGK
jgi:hypothetical protein